MFAYCFNNPVNMSDPSGNWPQWMKNAAKWVAKNIVKPVVDKVQNTLTQKDFTYSTGIGTGGSISGFGIQLQGGLSLDSKGNMAIQGTVGLGLSTSDGCTGTVYNTITNAPNISSLDSTSYQLGGLYGWNIGYVPVIAGGDISYIPDSKSTKEYYGLTFTTGFGSPGLELNANWSYGGTLPYSSINIFDVANDYYQTIMEW